ncbi:MAG: aminotransferase class IV [Kofleriaceae bacterium]|nr:aminotransferase class IV [Kofleriaceae bacterium]
MSAAFTILVDGEPADSISVLDRGLLSGDGCFEVLRTWGGRAVDLDAHLARMYDTAAFLNLRTRAREVVHADVLRALAATRGDGERRIRIVLTRGPGSLALPLEAIGPGRAIVVVEPLPAQPKELSLALVDWPLPSRTGRGHKLLAYADHIIALELARTAGADEAIRLDADGAVAEGATSNVFLVDDAGVVETPATDRGVLPGIVRGRILEWCAREGLSVRVRPIGVDELHAATEIFVSSSLRGVVPATRLERRVLSAGPITARIAAGYAASMRAA